MPHNRGSHIIYGAGVTFPFLINFPLVILLFKLKLALRTFNKNTQGTINKLRPNFWSVPDNYGGSSVKTETSLRFQIREGKYSGGQLKINKALFSYKMPIFSMVENYQKVMKNLPFFTQLFALMFGLSQ